ncbi:MAG: LysR family transcriptional regulator [Bacillota bacterium]
MKTGISLDLYQIFCIVVSAGNMSAAAKQLYISQPAVSMAIRQLEELMGSPLLIRTPKGVHPTAEGKILYHNLEKGLRLIETAQEKFFQMVQMEKGELTISAGDTIVEHFLLPYLEKYHTIYPEILIKAINRTTCESLDLLAKGTVDVCFVNLPIEDNTEYEVTPCFEVHDVIVGGKQYQSLQRTGLTPQELKEYPFILLVEESNTRKYIENFLKENGVTIHPFLELGSNDLLMSFAKMNFGLTSIVKEFAKELDYREDLFEIPLEPPIPPRQIGMVRMKNTVDPHALQGFIKLLKDELSVVERSSKKILDS